MSGLPKGWISTELENCVEIHDSTRVPINNSERDARIRDKDTSDLFPYFGATGQVGFIDDFIFDGDFVALGEDGVPFFDPLKHKAYLLKGKTWVNNHAHVIKGKLGIDNRYLCYFLNQFDYHGFVNGATRLKLTQASMRKIPVKLAPLNEQIRIADKLDSILAKVNKAQERLYKIPGILKRFRQSVLAAATSGELTREWRNTSVLISENWEPKTLRDVAISLDPNPSHRYPESDSTGVPILSTQQFVGMSEWTTDKAKLVSREFFEERKEKTGFYSDDIIFARKGRLGLARFAPKDLDYVYSHTVFIVRASKFILSKYLLWFLRDESVIDWLIKEMNSNTGVPTLGKAVFDKLPIALPSLEEQSEIVGRIETLFELADAVESQYIAAKHRVDRINQAILDKAFRGELVKQNPNDVPASELLKHIKSSADEIKPKKKAVSKSNTVKTKINKQAVSDLSERVDEHFISDLSAEKHNAFDSLRVGYRAEIQKAQELLVDAKFSVEQFRSITGFKGGYDELKSLIMNLLKGIPSVSEPLLAVESWDEKSGDYLMRLVKQK